VSQEKRQRLAAIVSGDFPAGREAAMPAEMEQALGQCVSDIEAIRYVASVRHTLRVCRPFMPPRTGRGAPRERVSFVVACTADFPSAERDTVLNEVKSAVWRLLAEIRALPGARNLAWGDRLVHAPRAATAPPAEP
jgi:hypothetical protein